MDCASIFRKDEMLIVVVVKDHTFRTVISDYAVEIWYV